MNRVSNSLPLKPNEIEGASSVSSSPPDRIIKAFTLANPTNPELFNPRVGEVEKNMLGKRVRAGEDYGIDQEAALPEELERSTKRFFFKFDVSSIQGKRVSHEDAHTIIDSKYGRMIAICDGHGLIDKDKLKLNQPQMGLEFARLVTKSIEEDLPKLKKKHYPNTKEAFEIWADEIHEKLPEEIGGTTAAIGFIEKVTNYLHVANIGDSAVVVFRKKGGKIFPIPMCPIKNWDTPECVDRVKNILSPEEFEIWLNKKTKERRFPFTGGVNLSSTLGDKKMLHKGKTALTHFPECSLLPLLEGDLIVFGCDGLFDFVTLDGMVEDILNSLWDDDERDLASHLTAYALKKKSTDNVTVITVRVSEPENPPRVLKLEKTAHLSSSFFKSEEKKF